MTVSEDFIPMQEEQGAAPPPGSVVFAGQVITPKLQGILIGVLGLGLAGFLGWKMLLPALEEQANLNTQIEQKKNDIEQAKRTANQLAEAKAQLEQAKQQKENVLTLLSGGQGLDTLLLDVNQIVKSSGGKLQMFQPVEQPQNDWMFGDAAQAGAAPAQQQPPPAADGTQPAQPAAAPTFKLSQAVEGERINLEMQGNYQQTLNTLRQIERLQQMVIVGDFTAELDADTQKIFVNPEGKITDRAQPILNSEFNAIAVKPLPPEQLQQLAAPPAPPPGDPAQQQQPAQ